GVPRWPRRERVFMPSRPRPSPVTGAAVSSKPPLATSARPVESSKPPHATSAMPVAERITPQDTRVNMPPAEGPRTVTDLPRRPLLPRLRAKRKPKRKEQFASWPGPATVNTHVIVPAPVAIEAHHPMPTPVAAPVLVERHDTVLPQVPAPARVNTQPLPLPSGAPVMSTPPVVQQRLDTSRF